MKRPIQVRPRQTASHQDLVEAAQAAILNLHCDTSVSPEQTRSDLQELRDDISMRIDAVNCDLAGDGEGDEDTAP